MKKVLKAVSKHNGPRRKIEQVIDPGDIPMEPPEIPDDDGLVMIVFPRDAWDKVQEIAKRANVAPAEVLSEALRDFDEKLNKLSGC